MSRYCSCGQTVCVCQEKMETITYPDFEPRQQGWECHKCGRVNAPTTPSCPCYWEQSSWRFETDQTWEGP